jgi:hypothetical protein
MIEILNNMKVENIIQKNMHAKIKREEKKINKSSFEKWEMMNFSREKIKYFS